MFGIVIAFKKLNFKKGIWGSPWCGFDNFKFLFASADAWIITRNTIFYNIAFFLVGNVTAIAVAILINEIKSSKFRKLVQTFTTLPNFISWIVVFTLTFAMFSADGMVNGVLRKFGAESIMNPLGNNDIAWGFQWALATWKSLGWNAIIYIAAITGIDSELYDAVHVDGANRWQTIWHVTVPGLYSTFFVLLLLQISNILSNGFDQYFVFYNPLTADKLEVLDYYVYKIGVLTNNYPQSIALGMFKTIISVTLLFGANKLSQKMRGESIV